MPRVPSTSGAQTTEVVVRDDEGPTLTFHSKRKLGTAVGYTTISVGEARERGAVPCSDCYDDQSCTNYPFDYCSGVSQ